MTDIQRITLDNGMLVMMRSNPATPTASFAFRIAMGSIDDPGDAAGLADIAAPLFSKGTKDLSAGEIAEKIDSLGLELSFSTGRHTAMLHGRVIIENLIPALKLCRELLENTEPAEAEVVRMKQRMQTGLTMQLDDPAAVATDRLRAMIYGNSHPYGRTIEQLIAGLQQIETPRITAFFRQLLKPGAIQAVVVGDIKADSLNKAFDTAFSSWDQGGSFEIAQFEQVKDAEEPQTEKIVMPGKTQTDVALGWQGITRSDPDYYALLVGNTALGRMSLGGRIGQRIREEEGMAYYAYSNFSAGVGAGPFAVRAGVTPEHVEKSISIALEELTRAKETGLTAEELDDSVKYLSGSMARQMETNGGLASVLLNQELFGLGDDYYRRFPGILADLTLKDVNLALSRHLKPAHYCCAIAGPEA